MALAEHAQRALHGGLETLKTSPFTCRKAGHNPFLREWTVPFGGTGYVALLEVLGDRDLVVAAARHQREDGDH